MIPFLQNVGAESVGMFWLPVIVWTCIAVFVLFLLSFLPQRHARVHADVRLALLAALPVAIITRLIPWGSGGTPTIVVPQFLHVQPTASVSGAVTSSGFDPVFWVGVLTVLVSIVFATGLSRLMWGSWQLRGILRRAKPISDRNTVSLATSAQRHLGLSSVLVVTSSEVQVPFSTGFIRQVVVLPDSLSRLDVLLHEMVHHHHGDLRRSWLVDLVLNVFLFHPLVHLISRQIRLYVEITCDAQVLMHPNVQKRRYAELLLHYAQSRALFRRATLSMADSVSQLQRRISAMKHPRPSEFRPVLIRSVSLAMFAFSVVLVSCTETDSMLTEADGPSLRVENDTTYIIVEENPMPIGGLEAVQALVEYPAMARKAGVEGRVYVQFVVDHDGRAEDIVVTRGIGAGCDEAAVEAIQQTRFTPGKQGGESVRVKMSLPVNFKLPEEERALAQR